MTAAITWLVLWALILLAVPAITLILIYVVGAGASLSSKNGKPKTAPVVVGVLLAGAAGLTLWIIAAINTINQIVSVIQLV